MSDQIHILVGNRPHEALPALVHIKPESAKWVRAHGLSTTFGWPGVLDAFFVQQKPCACRNSLHAEPGRAS